MALVRLLHYSCSYSGSCCSCVYLVPYTLYPYPSLILPCPNLTNFTPLIHSPTKNNNFAPPTSIVNPRPQMEPNSPSHFPSRLFSLHTSIPLPSSFQSFPSTTLLCASSSSSSSTSSLLSQRLSFFVRNLTLILRIDFAYIHSVSNRTFEASSIRRDIGDQSQAQHPSFRKQAQKAISG